MSSWLKTALPKQNLLSFSFHQQVKRNLFSFSLLSNSTLYAPSKYYSHSGSQLVVIDKCFCHFWWVFYVHNFCIFISYSNIKDLKLYMHMHHITNGCLHKRHVKQHVLFASGKWNLSQPPPLPPSSYISNGNAEDRINRFSSEEVKSTHAKKMVVLGMTLKWI